MGRTLSHLVRSYSSLRRGAEEEERETEAQRLWRVVREARGMGRAPSTLPAPRGAAAAAPPRSQLTNNSHARRNVEHKEKWNKTWKQC